MEASTQTAFLLQLSPKPIREGVQAQRRRLNYSIRHFPVGSTFMLSKSRPARPAVLLSTHNLPRSIVPSAGPQSLIYVLQPNEGLMNTLMPVDRILPTTSDLVAGAECSIIISYPVDTLSLLAVRVQTMAAFLPTVAIPFAVLIAVTRLPLDAYLNPWQAVLLGVTAVASRMSLFLTTARTECERATSLMGITRLQHLSPKPLTTY